MKRTLRLKREVLAELAGTDLVRIAGGTTNRPTMQVSCMEVESCFATGCRVFSRAVCLEME